MIGAFMSGLSGALGGSGGGLSGLASGLGNAAGSFLTQASGNLVNGLMFGSSADRRKMRKQQQYALEQMKVGQAYALEQMAEQQRLNREQYDYEYSKESPAARVAQLKAAGLNSGLMYGSGAAGAGMQGSVGTVSGASAPHASPPSGGVSMMFDPSSLLIRSEVLKNEAQADAYNAEAEEKRGLTAPQKVLMKMQGVLTESYEQDVAGKKIDNYIKSATQDYTIDSARVNLDNLKKMGNSLVADTAETWSKIPVNQRNYEKLGKEIAQLSVLTAIDRVKLHYADSKNAAEIAHLRDLSNLLFYQGLSAADNAKLTENQAKFLLSFDKEYGTLQQKLAEMPVDLKREEIDAYIHKAHTDFAAKVLSAILICVGGAVGAAVAGPPGAAAGVALGTAGASFVTSSTR